MFLDSCPEGGEGLVIVPKSILNLDMSRCTNIECELRHDCARFVQFTIELSNYIPESKPLSYTKYKPINGVCEFKIEIND